MFTGIVEDVGRSPPCRRCARDGDHGGDDLPMDTIGGGGLRRLSGVCLNRDAKRAGTFGGRLEGDALKTTLGGCAPGRRFKTWSGRSPCLGGWSHMSTARGRDRRGPGDRALGKPGIPYPGRSFYNEFMVYKGAVTVDGSALLSAPPVGRFELAIIPITSNGRHLGRAGRGAGQPRNRHRREVRPQEPRRRGRRHAGFLKITVFVRRRGRMPLSTIEEHRGHPRRQMVILVDDEDRENEGEPDPRRGVVTPEAINFMARHGAACLPHEHHREKALALNSPHVHDKLLGVGTAFTVSIRARRGVTTGISAHDRATRSAPRSRKNAKSDDLVRRATFSPSSPGRRFWCAPGRRKGRRPRPTRRLRRRGGDLRDR